MTRHIKENEQGKEAEVVRLRTPPRKIWIDNRHLVDGIVSDLRTPYDERDGKFTDLSGCLEVS